MDPTTNLLNSIQTKNLNPFEIGNEVMDSKVDQHLGLFALKKIPSQCFLRKCLFKCSRVVSPTNLESFQNTLQFQSVLGFFSKTFLGTSQLKIE